MSARYELRGNAAVITLDRADRMNAIDEAMLEAVDASLDQAERDTVRAILLTGSGRAFCAGGTLSEPLPDDAGLILETHLNPLLERLAALPVPLIAAVNGPAIGAGLSLALAADVVLAGRSATFGAGFVRVGLVPDGGLTWLLPRSIGHHRAMAMLTLGETLDAQTACDWGLVWKVIEDQVLADAGQQMLASIADGATTAIGAARRMIRQAAQTDVATALHAERAAQNMAGRSVDFREGATAFLQRREAHFTGR